jgi:predicted RNA-binding Zn-ribbon protein involved in translation (DUF1610 family)
MKIDLKLFLSIEQIRNTEDKWICPKCGHANAWSHSFCRGQGCSQPKPR